MSSSDEIIMDACEQLIISEGPMNSRELSHGTYENRWLVVEGRQDDCRMPPQMIEACLLESSSVTVDDTGRWHVRSEG